jgi:mRNA interferase MazF
LERGDVLELRAPRGGRGHEQSGPRYAVVLQAEEFWPASTLVVAPTSTSAQPRSFRPVVSLRDRKTTVLVDQMGASDVSRFGERVGRVPEDDLAEIDEAVIRFLGLSARF